MTDECALNQRSASSSEALGDQRLRPLLDVHEVARHLNVSTRWVYDRVQRGAIPHLRVGKHLRFQPNQLEEWIASLGG